MNAEHKRLLDMMLDGHAVEISDDELDVLQEDHDIVTAVNADAVGTRSRQWVGWIGASNAPQLSAITHRRKHGEEIDTGFVRARATQPR